MTFVTYKNDLNQLSDNDNLLRRLQAVIDTAIDGIITISSRGIIETINKAGALQFGYESEEVVGKNVKMLMPNPHHDQHDQYLKNYEETRIPKIIGLGREVHGKRKDGTLFPFRLAVSEVLLNDRIIYTGIIHDLTEVVNSKIRLENLNAELETKVEERTTELEDAVNNLLSLNQELQQRELALNQLLSKEKELNELKSRFVSMASHEFRTPLSTILSSADLLGKYQLTDEQNKREKHLVKIKSSVNQLTGILNDFLSLSKIEEGLVKLNKKDIEIKKELNSIISEIKPIKKEGQVISLAIEEGLEVVYTDPRILKNVLFNLISNAIKYSPADSEIIVEVNTSNNNYHFNVIDQGIGIPEEEQKFLFERFFRAKNVENINGTGLGLNIVKRYVDILNGDISFSSELNTGSKFFFNLPKRTHEKDLSH